MHSANLPMNVNQTEDIRIGPNTEMLDTSRKAIQLKPERHYGIFSLPTIILFVVKAKNAIWDEWTDSLLSQVRC